MQVIGVRVRVVLGDKPHIEAGEYLSDGVRTVPNRDCFVKTRIRCPFCPDDWLQVKTALAPRINGRVTRVLTKPKNGEQVVISDPIPKTHIVLACGNCKTCFTALNTPDSPYRELLPSARSEDRVP